ncbi:amidohydrolase/deacetylase family metallohydrolase [Companilactobacillus allii]|uniref:Dihydroorotase n=1 Tax=Companilactobacillus allii TaxID=1847728 RepID=A0A1P8Q0G9_9LACO|nr:amidohydrolase/deacetylase family metallohydrolase [Companilactobacillus allii]APX71321.1 dihydroorotase [Companilactobacillus allii]USQ68402.1 amidohydrolase/deacetylase family metallohydrolase [Companilactobacillus allii]
MADLYIKNGLNEYLEPIELLITNGKIERVSSKIRNVVADKTIDLERQSIVSAGWIDDHVHCYEKLTLYYDDPDEDGYKTGVTTVIDAGSTGANNIKDFYTRTRDKLTNVYAMINISETGILAQDELGDMRRLNLQKLQAAVDEYPDFIVGIKARISKSVVVSNGINPLVEAKYFQMKLNKHLPLMVHVGTNPPELSEIMTIMDKGDIMTHCFNGKTNGILDENDNIKDFVQDGYEHGIIFDVGHGTDSFNFHTAEIAKQYKLYPETLSTDIYHHNREDGPVYDMSTCIEKLLLLGYKISEIIPMITSRPAKNFGLSRKGLLKSGYDADVTIFDIKHGRKELTDSNGNTRITDTLVKPKYSIVGGNVYSIGGI